MDKLLSEFSIGLFFWQTILFLALILLLKKFAWKPILNAVNDREEGIKKALASAESAKKEMQNLTADNEALVKEARAEKLISEAKEDAKEQAAKMIDGAVVAIEQEKQAALAHLKKEVGDLSMVIAEVILKKELSSQEDQIKLVEGMLKDVTLN